MGRWIASKKSTIATKAYGIWAPSRACHLKNRKRITRTRKARPTRPTRPPKPRRSAPIPSQPKTEQLQHDIAAQTRAVEQAKTDLASGDVHSPADGIVIACQGDPGQPVDPSMKNLSADRDRPDPVASHTDAIESRICRACTPGRRPRCITATTILTARSAKFAARKWSSISALPRRWQNSATRRKLESSFDEYAISS